MSDDNEFRVWIGCLACYNDGTLLGEWHEAITAGLVTTQALHARAGVATSAEGYVLGQEVYGPHEELWCMDIENAPKGHEHEMSPYEAQQLAEAMATVEDTLDAQLIPAYFAWLANHMGQVPPAQLADHVDDFEDRLCGVFESFQEFADERADEWLGVPSTPCSGEYWDARMKDLGGTLEFALRYFDYNAHARDLAHEYDTYDVDGGVAVVTS